MKAAGVDVSYIMVEGAPHGGDLWHQPALINVVGDFFTQKLSK